MAKFNAVRAARILVEAAAVGDVSAAERHKTTVRTIERYRARSKTDPELSALVAKSLDAVAEDWAETARTFLAAGIKRLSDLIQQATPDQIHQVAGAIKIVGELAIVREAINGDQPSADRQGPALARAMGSGEAASKLH